MVTKLITTDQYWNMFIVHMTCFFKTLINGQIPHKLVTCGSTTTFISLLFVLQPCQKPVGGCRLAHA